MLEKTNDILVEAELDVALRAEGGVRCDGQAEELGVLNEGLLSQVWVNLDLKDLWLNAGITVDIQEE